MLSILDTVLFNGVTLGDLIWVLVFVIVCLLIAKVINMYTARALQGKASPDQLAMIKKTVNVTIVIIIMASILPTLGFDPLGFIMAAGILGIILGFASQSTIGNLIAGIFLMAEKPIKIGDGVKIDGYEGIIEEIRFMSVIVRVWDGYTVRIPNEKVFTESLTNYFGTIARRWSYTIGIRYADDADRAAEIIKKLIEDHSLILVNPPPQVFVDSLGDNSMNVIVRLWAPYNEWYGVKMEMLNRFKTALEAEGIQIAFPQRTVWLGDRGTDNLTLQVENRGPGARSVR